MIRRSPTRAVVLSVAAAVGLSACATFDNTDMVAEIDGTTISDDQLTGYLTEFADRSELFQATPIAAGRANADDARVMIGALVRQQLFRTFAADYDLPLDEVRQTFIDTTLASSPAADTSPELQELIADIAPDVQSLTLVDLAAPSVDELRSLYADDPARTGALCMRHILLETEAEADAVFDELVHGAEFAPLAAERSIDPSAADVGGALTDGASDCIRLQTVLQNFDPGFTAGALNAREGVPSEPVESSFGWHVIVHRPWDEVAESVTSLHQAGESGTLLYEGYRTTADVDINPRYGVWDPVVGGVLPLAIAGGVQPAAIDS